jgi:hypothetical protein
MKPIFLALILVTSVLGGCDRETLQGLNIKFQGEVNTDYDSSSDGEAQKSEVGGNESNPTTRDNSPSPSEKIKNQPVKEVKRESQLDSEPKSVSEQPTLQPDSDQPIAFKPMENCSPSGITAKTNEIYYSKNSQVKSIDSKNEKEMSEWKKIYAEVEAKCQ